MLLALLLGCPTPAPKPPVDTDTGCVSATWYKDTDGDNVGNAGRGTALACTAPAGYVAVDGDCDDLDDTVLPGATERCNEADDDCDGAVDEDAVDARTWYVDADEDGSGAGDGIVACEAPAGAVSEPGDCDDADPTVRPDMTERCGGGDEDCDGLVDEAGAFGAPSWFADVDADGYGDPGVSLTACGAPDGFVADTSDCDDAAADVSPDGVETCDGRDEDCDGDVDEGAPADAPAWFGDTDGDGYGDALSIFVACDVPPDFVGDATDCDDSRADVSPAGTEVCDTVDQDCDGVVDEAAVDAPTWYADTDSDGFGDPSSTVAACDAPLGFLADASDCDDTTAEVSPVVPETCDGRDEDCDGSEDEGAVDAPTWYADVDLDGYGDPSNTAMSCSQPLGYTADASDCDDADPAISPAADETCASPADDDCNGTIDDDPIDGDPWYRDADIDGRGDPAERVRACTRPTGYVEDGRDCDDTDPDAHIGALESCLDPGDEDCNGNDNDRDAFGCTTFYTDADGDGDGDPMYAGTCLCYGTGVTTPDDCDDTDAAISSFATELWGDGVDQDCDGRTDIVDIEDVGVEWPGSAWNDDAGFALAAPGDVDGDGDADVLVSSLYADLDVVNGGGVYLLTDVATGGSLSTSTYTLAGASSGDQLGYSISAGDADGDGVVDVLAGAPVSRTGGTNSGAVYLDLTMASGAIKADDVETVVIGDTAEYLGRHANFLGDLDGDGDDEWSLVAYPSSRFGILLMTDAASGSLTTNDASVALLGPSSASMQTIRSAALGDTDGDGLDDFAVGVKQWADTQANDGAVFVFFGLPADSELPDGADVALVGAADSRFGASVAAAGDCDGDGLGDLVVGATGELNLEGEAHVYTNVGAVASRTDAVTTYTGGIGSYLGTAVSGIGDFDGDSAADLAFTESAPSSYGALHLIYGCPTGTHDISEASATVNGGMSSRLGYNLLAPGDLDGDGLDDLAAGAPDGMYGAAWIITGR